MSTPKEDAYDEHISPLMTQIIALCKAHRINAAMTFSLDYNPDEGSPLFCTTVLPLDESDEQGCKRMKELARVMKPTPVFAAFTITTRGDHHG